MGRSRQWGTRALAVLTIASVAVVWAATTASAKQINSESDLQKSCSKGTGTFSPSPGKNQAGQRIGAVCEVNGGYVECNDSKKGKKCRGYHYKAREIVPAENVRGAHGVVMTTQEVSDSQTWKQKVSVADLGGEVCPSLGGQFLLSPSGASGACTTPTATLVCRDTGAGSSCLGVADTTKHAHSISKRAKAAAGGTPSSTAPSSSTPATTSTAPPTTKVCSIRGGCPQPTVPPRKAPTESVPVQPPK